MNNITKGCETCKWQRGFYCERPGGNDCQWDNEMRGKFASWRDWEPRASLVNEEKEITITKTKDKTIIVIKN